MIPHRRSASSEFLARSNNGPQFRSGPILLTPGDDVDFELAENPVVSNATVRSWRQSVE